MSLAALVAAALAAPAPGTGSAHVDAFVADIAAGRRDAAIGRIHEMNSLSGRPIAAAAGRPGADRPGAGAVTPTSLLSSLPLAARGRGRKR